MSNSIPRIKALDTLASNNLPERQSESAQKNSPPEQALEKRTTKERFLENLGLPTPRALPRSIATQFRRPAAALLPLTSTVASKINSQPVVDELALLRSGLLVQMQTLPAVESGRYKRFLDHTLLCKDPARQTLLLNLLGASITTAAKRLEIEDAAPSDARHSMWDYLARTSAIVQAQKSASSLPVLGDEPTANAINNPVPGGRMDRRV